MLIWVKAHWKLVGIVIVGLILIIYIGSVTGTNAKLYGMLLNQIHSDQEILTEDTKKYIADCEKEISDLQIKLVSIVAENQRLKGKVNEIQSKRKNIIVPNDPAGIVSDLRKMGILSASYRKN